MEETNMPQTYDELRFAESVEKIQPILETMSELLSSGRVSLKGQKYRIENNHLTIQNQEKQIANNETLIQQAQTKAENIILEAEAKAKEIDNGIRIKNAQINYMEREIRQKLEEADKILWKAKNGDPIPA